jgi:hypothetical protein
MQFRVGVALVVAATAIAAGFEVFWAAPIEAPNAQGQYSEAYGILRTLRFLVCGVCAALALMGMCLLLGCRGDPWQRTGDKVFNHGRGGPAPPGY